MIDAMRSANLEPPRFQDKRSSFWVTFRNHTLMSPAAVTWLNQFAGQPLNDHQRLALVYLRNNPYMTNNDYRRINHVDSVTANRELRMLVQTDLIKQHSTRRWAHYTLNLSVAEQVPMLELLDEEIKIMNYIKEKGFIKRADCQRLLGVSEVKARYILKKMRDRGLLRLEGSRKDARYLLP
jgi:predicted HTH transcriptional regulator